MNTLNMIKRLSFKNRPIAKTLFSTLALLSIFTSSITSAALDQTEIDDIVSDLGYTNATPIEKIYNPRVNGFNTVNSDSIVLNAGPMQRYLVTFTTHCYDVEFSQKIGFTTTLSQLTKFDNIIVSNRGTGREVCPIQDIYKLEA